MKNWQLEIEYSSNYFANKLKSSRQMRCYSGGSSGGHGSTTPQMTPQQLVALYQSSLPQALATTTNQAPAVAQSLGTAAYMSNPIYTASGLQQLGQYAGGYQQAGSNIANAQAQATSDLLNGTGAGAVAAGNALQQQYNPAQVAANSQAANLVNSINLNGLSGGEQAAVERSLNQSNYATGNMGLDNATNAVSNAMNFGNALQAKRAALGSALGTATGVSGQQNTNFNPTSFAMNAGNTANNFGLSTFNPTQANANLTVPYSFASSFGNQLAGISSASKGTTSSGSASGGCFLTTAACEFKGLPDNCELLEDLRQFRDKFVSKAMIERYYRISPIIAANIKDKPDELEYVFAVANKCKQLAHDNKVEDAICEYELMVNNLARKYVV